MELDDSNAECDEMIENLRMKDKKNKFTETKKFDILKQTHMELTKLIRENKPRRRSNSRS